jgi:hypothetical protein
METLKAMFSNKEPLLTKETADAAQSISTYDATKIQRLLPGFAYTPIDETVQRTCNWLLNHYGLK